MKRNIILSGWLLLPILLLGISRVPAAHILPIVKDVEWQPFKAQVTRVLEALEYQGSPVSKATRQKIDEAFDLKDRNTAQVRIQQLLDPYCLIGIHINPEMRVKVAQGAAAPVLDEKGWRTFLVKVANESGTTARLRAVSPHAVSAFQSGASRTDSDTFFKGAKKKPKALDPEELWLDMKMYDKQPLRPTLGGLDLEYRLLQLYSRDKGKREAKLSFHVGQGTQDIGFRNEVDILFTCQAAQDVTLRVKDEFGKPATGSFLIKDEQGRIYPSRAKRLAPDFAFHPQVYRADGDVLKLPAGKYTVEFSRGPESLTEMRTITVGDSSQEASFQVERWVDPSLTGWWSGDHHIHASGCAHYVKPSEGVLAKDMIRHVLGEDLKIGANLTWGPGFDYQKQFFCGEVDKVSQYPYLLRYDIEVSGFGSHQSGHLCLLRLKDQMYPGGDSKHHWPTLCLNTLKWAKKQGALTGPAHSGWGLEVKTADLPNYIVPPYTGIGANEYIVDVTHMLPGPDGKDWPAVDFLSTVDTPYVWELNMWYHTLNVGFRTRISGETDFPCIYGDKVGLGRSYVKLDGKLDYDLWCEGIRQGRNYVSDGLSHLMDFKINGLEMGVEKSEVALAKPGKVTVTARVAARLDETPIPGLRDRPYTHKPYWHLERARINESRRVPVEVIVNGYTVANQNIVADGKEQELNFDIDIDQSSWVSLRILPSSHTNPIFVLVDGKPIRASRRSAQWCLDGVEKCWKEKEKFIKKSEMEDAIAAYDHARETYRKRIEESQTN